MRIVVLVEPTMRKAVITHELVCQTTIPSKEVD